MHAYTHTAHTGHSYTLVHTLSSHSAHTHTHVYIQPTDTHAHTQMCPHTQLTCAHTRALIYTAQILHTQFTVCIQANMHTHTELTRHTHAHRCTCSAHTVHIHMHTHIHSSHMPPLQVPSHTHRTRMYTCALKHVIQTLHT